MKDHERRSKPWEGDLDGAVLGGVGIPMPHIDRIVRHEPKKPTGRETAKRKVKQDEPPDILERWHEMTIIAQDPGVLNPSATNKRKRILRAAVKVPTDRIWPGPRSHRFHVVGIVPDQSGSMSPAEDFSAEKKQSRDNYGWRFDDQFENASDARLKRDPRFYAQNVYAIAARTLATFESALGRRIGWAFDSHQLYLIPDAMEMANAFYTREDQAVCFGYFFDVEGNDIRTCLSHDIIAHEVTHAILDGLRHRFLHPGVPDQAAFHEAMADIVALLSVFSTRAVVERCLEEDGKKSGKFTMSRLKKSTLLRLAEEFGTAASVGARPALRSSVEIEPENLKGWRDKDEYKLPHRRGEILVAAVMQTFLRIWEERVNILSSQTAGSPSIPLVAQEGARSAGHLLKMVIRSIDYCPPVELTFEDFLDSILTADEEVAPDDEHKYRKALRDAFGEFDIKQPRTEFINLAHKPPHYETLNFAEFIRDRDEVFRFLWQNADILGIEREYFTLVEDVQPSVRVGPDGFVIRETVACYVQSIQGTLKELVAHSRRKLKVPEGVDLGTELRLWGGGVLIFDQFGRPKYHQRKDLWDWPRQSKRLRELVREGHRGPGGRLGFSEDRSITEPSQLHSTIRQREGEW